TGKLTFKLRERGYDMTGIDLSEGMLSQAHEYATKNNINDVLFLCQNMSSFELYGTVDACVCTLDSLNYLTRLEDLKKCLLLVKNYLIPDGVFVFDLNTPYRFEKIYGDNSYILEDKNTFLAWQNNYSKKSKICDFYLSIFEKQKNGSYMRYDEIQKEKCYSMKQIKSLLKELDFEIINVYGDIKRGPVTDESEKWYFTVRNRKI
ncbi:MAG: class I SAM-dependent methyltransferase, partial [Clostridia bacterium]|nr:class I SAM-dependent methyltransferase [Clostridia bacterium]